MREFFFRCWCDEAMEQVAQEMVVAEGMARLGQRPDNGSGLP